MQVDGKMVHIKGSPGLGADTADVLKQWLGIDAAQIEAMRADKVI